MATCSVTESGADCDCFNNSRNRTPRASWFCVAWSRSEANCENASSSANYYLSFLMILHMDCVFLKLLKKQSYRQSYKK